MPKNNTARPFYLVSNREALPATPPLSADKRPSGIGLAGAVLVSLALWQGLIWLGVIAVRALAA